MNKTQETLKKIKNHVEENKAAYVMGVITTLVIALQQTSRIQFYKFLESKGIDPEEFYCPEAYEERNA